MLQFTISIPKPSYQETGAIPLLEPNHGLANSGSTLALISNRATRSWIRDEEFLFHTVGDLNQTTSNHQLSSRLWDSPNLDRDSCLCWDHGRGRDGLEFHTGCGESDLLDLEIDSVRICQSDNKMGSFFSYKIELCNVVDFAMEGIVDKRVNLARRTNGELGLWKNGFECLFGSREGHLARRWPIGKLKIGS